MAALNSNSARENQSREYCLRWNNHQPNLVHYFGTLLSRESFADVTLVSSEGKKIHCHKMILSSCSPYFQRVFEGNPCKHPIVILKDIDYADLQTIITFIYHGEVNISQDRISSILMTANSLQVKGLAEVPAGDLRKSTGNSSVNRKRESSREVNVEDGSGAQQQASAAPHLLHPSNSLGAVEDLEENSAQADIPKKKLRKSASAAATCGSSTVSTNGEHSSSGGSLEFGASTSRSVDETSNPGEGRTSESTLTRGTSGPPPLQPVTTHHLPGKSKSLDHIHDRDAVTLDSELSSGGFSESHTYEDASGGAHRTGYELDIADVKIEAVSDDGEIEFEDDEDEEEEPYGHSFSLEFNEINQSYPNVPSSSSLFHNPVHQFASSQLGFQCRRGRPLIRQPRVKRPDNETGGELCIDESRDGPTDGSKDDDEDEDEDHNVPARRHVLEKRRGDDGESVTVPIVTVSQSSPTPPASPIVENPVPSPTSNKSHFSTIITSSNGASTTMSSSSSSSSTNIVTSSSSSSLLMVPSVVESVAGGGSSSTSGSTLSPSNVGGVHLVKQISQPLLPSHTTVLSSTSSSSNNPVIRRQHSQPNPVSTAQIVTASSGTRIFPLTAGNTLKRGTLYQLLPHDSGNHHHHHHHHSSKDEDASPVGSAIFLESSSLVQLVPTGDGTNRITITPAFTNMKEERKECLSPGDLSPEVTVTLKEESGSVEGTSDGSSSSSVVHRAGHCPALRPGPALGCNFCWNSVDECGRILRRKTKYHCPECHINLCIVPCFQEYHEKAEKKKARSKLGLPKPSSM